MIGDLVRQRSATPNILLPTGNRLPLQLARDTPTIQNRNFSSDFDSPSQKPRPYSAVPHSTTSDYGRVTPSSQTRAPASPTYQRHDFQSTTPQIVKQKPPTPPPSSRSARDRLVIVYTYYMFTPIFSPHLQQLPCRRFWARSHKL